MACPPIAPHRVLALDLVVAVVMFFLFFASSRANSIPLESSRLSRVLEIHEREREPASVQEEAVRGLLDRLLPSHSSSFEFKIVSKEYCGGKACFIINNHPSFDSKGSPEILIHGVTGVEISAGLHWYLKYYCTAHVSWEKTGGAQLLSVPQPGTLPHVPSAGILVQRPVQWSYYQNAVTSSYSFAWWDWERWEKEIDWMALQGINLPLAFTGQEAIWQKVFQGFNISSSDLNNFFGGPGFLAWSRMGNLHGWGGPLPQSWLDDQLALQKKILTRMYNFGMTPVLPAFSGNVPFALKSKFPSAKVTHLGNWFTVDSDPRWCCTYLLDATDPLFIEIGKSFMEQQIIEYGRSSHIYNCDTFDENTPPTDDPEYISSLGAAIYQGMQSGDDAAIWLMQGWLFSYDPFWQPPQMKALLHSVPIGQMVVLDLYAEVKPMWISSEQFYGVPYIWKVLECMLHNFAANIEMYGILDVIASGPIEARLSHNSTMVGVGMCMEGIEQNPIVYDLMSEMAFRQKQVDAKIYMQQGDMESLLLDCLTPGEYYIRLSTTALMELMEDKNRDVIVAFPDVDPSIISTAELPKVRGNLQTFWNILEGDLLEDDAYDRPHLWYSSSDVVHALELFLENGGEVSDMPTFRYDLVDLTRQALAKYANQVFLKVIEGFKSNDVRHVSSYSQRFLDIVKDLDMLLACHEGFLLGPWLQSAKSLARDLEQEKQSVINEHNAVQFEWNARTQITMWFDNTETKASLLRDYGNKYWNGLLREYYGPRAAIYFKYLIESMAKGVSFPLEDWRREWISLTNKWQSSRNIFTVKATGDALNISRWLYDKYLRNGNLREEYKAADYLTKSASF
ncbi:Alpha-N-acetylglucosaminidase [Ananas comosus]|uniref:Alpha-N-acetylglucosaminidase n=1 Tax=Ananas comosus TaxID=4615 RepID=A0A199W3P3_ANACO|nr:Alpha-N-acetylglucosaminidase [Ananas comosus]